MKVLNNIKNMEIAFKTKNEAVYENLRKEIIEGGFKPGEKIIISNLARTYGVSETPIREAIRKLESEGLLLMTPHVGTTVSKVNYEELIEFSLIRTELECLATKLAIPYISVVEAEKLEMIIHKMEAAISRNDYEILGNLNKSFHSGIYRLAPYPHLLKMIMELWEKTHLIQNSDAIFVLAPERANESLKEHKDILEAIKQKNADRAVELVRSQKQKSRMALAVFHGKAK